MTAPAKTRLSNTVSEVRVGEVMGENIGGVTLVAHDGGLASVRLPKGAPRETETEELSRRFGQQPATWHARISGAYPVNLQFAQVLEVKLRRNPASAAAWLAHADAVLAGVPTVKLDTTVCREAFDADHAEDLELVGFMLQVAAGQVTKAECERMLDKIDAEMARKRRLRAAIVDAKGAL